MVPLQPGWEPQHLPASFKAVVISASISSDLWQGFPSPELWVLAGSLGINYKRSTNLCSNQALIEHWVNVLIVHTIWGMDVTRLWLIKYRCAKHIPANRVYFWLYRLNQDRPYQSEGSQEAMYGHAKLVTEEFNKWTINPGKSRKDGDGPQS